MARSTRLLILAGLVVAIALVVFVAPFANPNPDGLERVAIDQGIDSGAQEHDLASSPLAGYGVDGVHNSIVGTALAGVVGVTVVFGVGYGLFAATKRLGSRCDVSGRHDDLYVASGSALHRLAPHAKVAATVAFVFAVVATPREAVWAFAIDAAVVVVTAIVGSVPLVHIVRRLGIEVPFLLFAVFLPFVGRPPTVEVLGLSLSQAGLWAAWGILVKASLGVAAAVLLASTTTVPDILSALERLRVPTVLVAITAFMIRYGDVLTDDLRRMRIARESRAADPRWLWQARAVASTAGTLFVRSYERGERVHQAMQARGYAGTMPPSERASTGGLVCVLPVLVAVAAAFAAWSLR